MRLRPLRTSRPPGRPSAETVLVLALLACVVAPPAATASVQIRPVEPGQAWVKLRALRGATTKGTFIVENPTRARQAVKLYAVDARIQRGGAFVIEDERLPRDDVGVWVTPSQSRLVLAPLSRRRLSFSLDMPAGAAPGLHVGAIVAQGAAQPAKAAGGATVLLVQRIGLRLYVRVPADANSKLAVSGARVDEAGWSSGPLAWLGVRHGRQVRLSARVDNRTANRLEDASARLVIGRGNSVVSRGSRRRLRAFGPAESRRVSLDGRLPGGSSGYWARIEVTDGDEAVFAERRLELSAWGVDWVALARALGALALLVLAVLFVRRRMPAGRIRRGRLPSPRTR